MAAKARELSVIEAARDAYYRAYKAAGKDPTALQALQDRQAAKAREMAVIDRARDTYQRAFREAMKDLSAANKGA